MSKFNQATLGDVWPTPEKETPDTLAPDAPWPEPDMKNYEGEPVHQYSDHLNLSTRALTSLMAENKFYESAKEGDNEIVRLFEKMLTEDPEFAKGLVLTLRKEFHMRSVTHVLCAELARNRTTETAHIIAEVCERPDDMLEILAYYTNKYGDKKLPNSLKKGLARALGKFNEYQLAKYNKKGKVWLRDILRIAHPKPKDEEQAALWGRLAKDELATPDTWEVKTSTKGSTKETWEEMLESGKMGYMALMRNLRNILQKDVSMDLVKKAAAILSDPDRVAKSKQLPFRFFSAFRALKEEVGLMSNGNEDEYYDELLDIWVDNPKENDINLVKAEIIFDALEEAARLAAKNMPQLEGKTAIACDSSGSMQHPISERSSVQCYDIGMIMGALANRFSDDSIVGMFADSWKKIEVDGNKPLSSTLEMHRRIGEVGYSTNGYKVIKELLETRQKVDRVMFFTDCQLYGGDYEEEGGYDPYEGKYNRGIGSYIREYREKINPHVKLYFFDLSGYGSCVVPEQDPQTMIVGGWSEKLFTLIPQFEAGNQTAFLDQIRGRYAQWQAARRHA